MLELWERRSTPLLPSFPDPLRPKVIVPDKVLIICCPVVWGCRVHRLLLCREVRLPPNECPGYDIKQSDGEVSKMLELWGIQTTPLLPLLPGPLWPEVVALDRVLSMA